MNTNLPTNSAMIYQLKEEATKNCLFQAYLESAPQLIFQLSIILKNGFLCKSLYKHLIASLGFLTVAKRESYWRTYSLSSFGALCHSSFGLV